MSNNPIERVIVEPKDGQVVILHGDIQVHQFKGTAYKAGSMDSVIELVKWKGSKERTVISYNDEKVQVILDDTIMDRPQDKITYLYQYSDAFIEWRNILSKPLGQKEFIDFLKRRPTSELLEIEGLLATVQRLNLVTEIIGDYQYDDNNNITVMFKTKDSEGSAKLPAVLEVNLTLLNESAKIIDLEIELELRKPKSENEKPAFIMTCPKLTRYIKEAVEYEVKQMKEALEGYLIVAGGLA